LVSIVDREFKFTFFGSQNHRLPFHAADHVEGGFGFPTQCHLQQVFFDPGFDGFAEFRSDFEEAIGRTEAFYALVRPPMVIIFDPETDPFPGRLEAFKLGTR